MTKSRFNPTFIAAQTQKNEVLARIEEDYPITRRNGNNCSRGLERGNLECYRLAVLQCLLHQPKALRWLLTHDIVETDDEGNFLRTVNPYVNQRRNPATGERIHSSNAHATSTDPCKARHSDSESMQHPSTLP
jgi:hypothetical protein